MKYYLALFFTFLISISYAQEFTNVYFESNKFELLPAEKAKLQQWISENKNNKIVAIHGFTDEDGSTGLNDTLSQKRVNYVFGLLKNQVKIRDDFKTISFGERFKQSSVKAENRRVTIYFILEKDIVREDEILGLKLKIVEEEEIIPIEEEEMNFPENATLQQKIELSKKGTLIRLKDINFHINSFGIIPNSKRAIEELIYVLNKNPNLRIEIQGHICCVNADIKNLSFDRAKQVRRVLVSEGISGNRIEVKGFGVSKPKFPIPEKNEFEAARNRRVEIMILEK